MSVYSFTERYRFYILCKSTYIFIDKDLVCSVNPFKHLQNTLILYNVRT